MTIPYRTFILFTYFFYRTFKKHSLFTALPSCCLFLFVILTIIVCGVLMMCQAPRQALEGVLPTHSRYLRDSVTGCLSQLAGEPAA